MKKNHIHIRYDIIVYVSMYVHSETQLSMNAGMLLSLPPSQKTVEEVVGNAGKTYEQYMYNI